MKKAVITSIEAIPILGTRYIDGARPHWTSLDPNDFCRAFVTAWTEMEFDEFLVSRVDECLGPQIRVCILDSPPFAVALKMNHMVCDAAGFKDYLYLLCQIYSSQFRHQSTRAPARDGFPAPNQPRFPLARLARAQRLTIVGNDVA